MKPVDLLQDLEARARRIQRFEWEGKPHKSARRVHTVEEYQAFLEEMRQSLWRDHDQLERDMGWKD